MDSLDRMITVDTAAQRGIEKHVLTNLIHSGMIRAAIFRGDTLVNENDINVATIDRSRFSNLDGVAITILEASEKYQIGKSTIAEWVRKGYIDVITPGYRKKIDEADMAYCASVYHAIGGSQGRRTLDSSGKPYRLKDLAGALYRREYRAKKNGKSSG